MINLEQRAPDDMRQAALRERQNANKLRVSMPGVVQAYDADQQTVTVRYKAESLSRINDVKFYGLNLDTFRDLTDQLRESAPASLSLGKGKVSIDTQGSDGEILFTSIPYDDGWTIKRNGDKITPVLFENCLICIPLRDGENHIQMTYTAPGLRPGIVLSILGICALAAAAALKRHSFRSRGNR